MIPSRIELVTYEMLSTSMHPSRVHDLYILISIVVTVSDLNSDTQKNVYETANRTSPSRG